MATLILVRHGESVWNEKGLWTGLVDVSLTEKGRDEAKRSAKGIKDIRIDMTFTSPLKRAKETLVEMQKVLFPNYPHPPYPPNIEDSALNERDYGVLTGKNKWEIQRKVGESAFKKIRRGWNTPIEGGETLKDVYNRVVPFYKKTIEPLLRKGKNVLVVPHGNSIRALVKYLEHISNEDIEHIELATGEAYVYEIDDQGTILKKEIR